jgi:hypothetical protein
MDQTKNYKIACVYQVSFRSDISFLRYCAEMIAPPGRHSSYYKASSTLLIMRFVGQSSRSQLLKIEQKFDTFFVSARYLRNEILDLNETWYTHELCPTNLIINRLPPLTIRHMCTKFHSDPTFCS